MKVNLRKRTRLVTFVAVLVAVAAGGTSAISAKADRPDRSLPAREPPTGVTLQRVTITPRSGSPVVFFARSYEHLGLSTGSTGAHEYVPFTVSKGVDEATSPRLARLFATGEALQTVQVEVLDATASPL